MRKYGGELTRGEDSLERDCHGRRVLQSAAGGGLSSHQGDSFSYPSAPDSHFCRAALFVNTGGAHPRRPGPGKTGNMREARGRRPPYSHYWLSYANATTAKREPEKRRERKGKKERNTKRRQTRGLGRGRQAGGDRHGCSLVDPRSQ